jgi:hypothetical protein
VVCAQVVVFELDIRHSLVQVPAPALRERGACGGGGRLYYYRDRHRLGPHRPGPRRGRLPGTPLNGFLIAFWMMECSASFYPLKIPSIPGVCDDSSNFLVVGLWGMK